MKALRVVGTVVAVVAIAATGLGAIAGASLAAGGAGTALGVSAAAWGTIATVSTIAALGISLAQYALARPPTFSREGNALQFQTNPQSGLPYPIGRTRMSGLRIHADTYDAPSFKSESKDDILSFAVMLGAGGPMEEIESFKADKQTIAFDGTSGNATGSYSNWMAQKVSLGLAGASALALAFGGGNFPGWTTDHKLSGIAHALWDLRFDPEGDHYGAGLPVPEWVGKWVKVYDPRLDSTYPGGSGSHRALDESTYEWSANPALHALTWALGRWQNSKRTLGIGAPVANIHVSDFVEAANVADANGWTCGGVEWSTDSKWAILKRMLQAGGAEPTMTGAMIGCRVNTPRVSVAAVTQDDLLDNLSFPTTRSRRERFNTVVPRYRSEAHDWEIISGQPISVSAYVADDGGVRSKEIDLPLVQKETDHDGDAQAGQLATYEIVNSREAGPIRFTVGPKFIGVKTGDALDLDVPDHGLDAQQVIVRKRSIDPSSLRITFEVDTETDGKHDFALGKTSVPPATFTPTPPDLTPPTPSASLWSLTAVNTGGVQPSLLVEGVCEFPGADTVAIQYRKTGATSWKMGGFPDASLPVEKLINSVEGGEEYEARIAYRSGNRFGGWLTLGPVTTPTFDLAADFADLQTDFNAQNNRNSDAISAATIATDGTAVDHTIADNGSANLSFEWTWGGTEADIDGFEVLLYSATSSSAYTIGSNVPGELVVRMPPNRRAMFVLGVPTNLYYTFAVRAYRVVDADLGGVIYSSWVKPSITAENPYRPSASVAFAGNLSGTVNGVAASTISATVDVFTGNIATGKVVETSIADGAINEAGYVQGGGTISLSTSDTFQEYFSATEIDMVDGDTAILKMSLPYEIIASGASSGDEPSFAFNLILYSTDGSPTPEYFSDTITTSERYRGAAEFGKRTFEFEWRVTVDFDAPFALGWRVTTDSKSYGFIYKRFFKMNVLRAMQ